MATGRSEPIGIREIGVQIDEDRPGNVALVVRGARGAGPVEIPPDVRNANSVGANERLKLVRLDQRRRAL